MIHVDHSNDQDLGNSEARGAADEPGSGGCRAVLLSLGFWAFLAIVILVVRYVRGG